jgi:CubicO group peptidase (beta-lactamase class C family)
MSTTRCAVGWPATLLAAAVCVFTPNYLAAGVYEEIEEAVKVAAEKTPGRSVSIGIVENGKLVSEQHYGSTQIGRTVLPTSKTLYPIASITKVFTGIMFLQLVDRGVVHLTVRVDKYVPELASALSITRRRMKLPSRERSRTTTASISLSFSFIRVVRTLP